MGDLYRLYVDESGDHHYHADYSDPKFNNPSERYLALMGIAIERAVKEQAIVDLEDLKRKHFDYDPDDSVILHRNEIINRQGPFYVLQDPKKEEEFNKDLINYLKGLKCVMFLVVIDKKYHIETYGKSAFHPYHYTLTAMVERYCGYLNYFNHKGDVWAEKRGKVEDRELEKAYLNLYNGGTYFHKPSFFQMALTTKKIKIKSKKSNVAGLQIADTLAHPCKHQYLYEKGKSSDPPGPFGMRIYEAVKWKYNMQIWTQKIEGWGRVYLG